MEAGCRVKKTLGMLINRVLSTVDSLQINQPPVDLVTTISSCGNEMLEEIPPSVHSVHSLPSTQNTSSLSNRSSVSTKTQQTTASSNYYSSAEKSTSSESSARYLDHSILSFQRKALPKLTRLFWTILIKLLNPMI